jgi:mannosyltransferase OCH1-like enzyme
VIPKTIHHIWVGPDPLPEELRPYVESWKRYHPDWEHRFWSEDNLPEDPVRPEVLNRLRSPVERSDMLRIEILNRHGGVYVDTDLECLRPIDEELAGEPIVGTTFKPDRVTNTFLASEPNHPLLERALDEMRPREFHGFDKNVAGPPFLAELIKDFPDMKLLEPRLLFPATPEEQETAIAIHHMTRTWKDADGLRKSMVRAEERLEKTRAKLEQERRRHAATQKRVAKLEAQLAAVTGKREKKEKKEKSRLLRRG